ncbi:hypothetical protein BDV97DRAFT_125088 [Delphinella strobiligena]|nr:hypothetical protein BDV97DRAFT_125088 [Delphinella strobiligena]
MNRSGANPQALRSIPQNVYGSQPNSNRNSPMASQRLQNGKLGGGGASSWGFGMPAAMAGGVPGLSNTRPPPLSNFAQAAMGASNSQASLDLSEFPSLSGGPSQPNNVSQAWNSTAIRQQPAVQRPQPQQTTQARVLSGQHQQQLALDSQFDGQSAAASRGGNNQTQSATADFPPLGGQLNGDRRRQAPGLNGLGQVNGQADQSSDSGSLDALRSPSETYQTPSSLQDAQEVGIFIFSKPSAD